MSIELPVTINGTLRIDETPDGAAFHCVSCGHQISSAAVNWKEHVTGRTMGPGDDRLPPYVTLHHELHLVEYSCPNCDRMLDVSVQRKDEPPIMDIELDL